MDDREGTDCVDTNLLESTKDKSSSPLLSYKLGFFALFGARGVVVSFYPLYLKQLGLTPEKIGIVMFFRPIGGFVGAVFTSFLTSRYTNYSLILYFVASFFLLTGISINFLSPPSLAICCNNSVEALVFNVTSEAAAAVEPRGWLWLYDGNLQYLFVCSILIAFSIDLFGIVVDTVQQGITMMALGTENTAQYGIIRAWGALGNSTAAVSAGLLVWSTQSTLKICTHLVTVPQYRFFSFIFMGFAMVLLLSLNTAFSSPEKTNGVKGEEKYNTVANKEQFVVTLFSWNVLPWLYVLMSRSIFCAVTQGFLNWHMENIGASPLLIGCLNGVTTATEFIMFSLTPFLIRRFGSIFLVSVGITSYVIRFLIFSFVTQPMYILPVEIFEGMMFAILWASLVAHLSSHLNDGKQSQMQGVILSVHMLGTGIGFLLSGYLTQSLGAQVMFRVFACIASFSSVVFILTQAILHKRNKSQ